jgi:cardiolipin synthase A/B
MAGCASLPRLVPDMAVQRGTPAKVVDAHGPLSAQRSKEILDVLRSRKQHSSFLDRHLALEEAIVGSPLVAGNKVRLLQDGAPTYDAMLATIRGARDHVNLETYIIEGDEVGRLFADALLDKQHEGVQVNVIYDSVGANRVPAEFFQRLRDGGIKLLEYNPLNPLKARVGWDVNERDHRKLLIVDGKTAFLGGINISAVYSGGSVSRTGTAENPDRRLPWRDTHLQLDGPVVRELQTLFFQTWERQHGDPLPARNYFPTLPRAGDEVVRAIGGSPDEPFSLIYATLVSAINNAESEIFLTNAYFVPDPQLREALKAAAGRGVDVRLVLPSSSDNWLVFHAGRSYYEEMLQSGVKLYERRDALLHCKTGMIDGVWSTVGSTNLDWRSFLFNQELNAVVLGADFGTQMRAVFERDQVASERMTLEQWQHRPLMMRLRERLARLWQYWL